MLLSMPLSMGTGAMGKMGPLSRLSTEFLPFLLQIPTRALELSLLLMAVTGMALAWSEVYKPAWSATLHRTTNMNTLVALGTISALLYSAVATLAPALFTGHGLHAQVYYESVLFILAFLLLGRWLEARAKDRTQDALQGFLRLLLLAAGDRKEEMIEAVEVKAVELAKSLLLAGGEPPCQQRDGRPRCTGVRGSPHTGERVQGKRE